MILRDFREYYLNQLSVEFPAEECQSLFYITTEYILNLSKIEVAINLQRELIKSELQQLNQVINRLLNHEPIQYIIGSTEFYGLQIQVNKYVLIPRPETEELVDWIIKDITNDSQLNILDIGTGSGCIAIALAKYLRDSKISALDVSEEALKVAKSNAQLNQVDIDFILKDILNFNDSQKMYNVIVSNPPYVRHSESLHMKKNVLDNEPHLALFVEDEDALLFYRKIINFAKKSLNLRGALYFEINEYLGPQMVQLMSDEGFSNIELRHDIFNKDRMIKGVKL